MYEWEFGYSSLVRAKRVPREGERTIKSLRLTFSSGSTVMSFMLHFVFLVVTAWYIGVKLER